MNYKVNFKDFLYQIVCVFPQIKDITYQTGFSFFSLDHAPGVGLGDAQGSQKSNFPNIVMWHIKVKGW